MKHLSQAQKIRNEHQATASRLLLHNIPLKDASIFSDYKIEPDDCPMIAKAKQALKQKRNKKRPSLNRRLQDRAMEDQTQFEELLASMSYGEREEVQKEVDDDAQAMNLTPAGQRVAEESGDARIVWK